MCSVTKVTQAFVLVTDTYKKLTRHTNYTNIRKKYKRKNDIYI